MHPLQSSSWGEFRKAMGIDVVRTHGWQITFHKIPYTPWTIGYFPKGPNLTSTMIGILKKLGKEKNAIYIQLEPDTTKKIDILPSSHHPLFTKYTFILDLTKSEDELLKSMHSKTRYNLRVAERHGVVIREDKGAFDTYLRLTDDTTARQKFFAHNHAYHQTMWDTLSKAGIAHLFTATYNKQILSAWIIFALGDTMYYPYGASSREHKEVMAPTLMLWEIAKWGKASGYKKFDLWGALGPSPTGEPDPKDPWYGFHKFKQGFAPQLVEFAGSFDLIINPFLYKLYAIADRIRWALLK